MICQNGHINLSQLIQVHEVPDLQTFLLIDEGVTNQVNLLEDVQGMGQQNREHLKVVTRHHEEWSVLGSVQVQKAKDQAKE